MRTRARSSDVLYPDEPTVHLDWDDIQVLRVGANRSERKRMRLCAHPAVENALHEMIIVLAHGTYVRPHRHLGRSESYHVIEGVADLIFFDDTGMIVDVIELGDVRSGKCWYCRVDRPMYHTVRVRSAEIIFHETTNGPFDVSKTEFAGWAPGDQDQLAVELYLRRLEDDLFRYRNQTHETEGDRPIDVPAL